MEALFREEFRIKCYEMAINGKEPFGLYILGVYECMYVCMYYVCIVWSACMYALYVCIVCIVCMYCMYVHMFVCIMSSGCMYACMYLCMLLIHVVK